MPSKRKNKVRKPERRKGEIKKKEKVKTVVSFLNPKSICILKFWFLHLLTSQANICIWIRRPRSVQCMTCKQLCGTCKSSLFMKMVTRKLFDYSCSFKMCFSAKFQGANTCKLISQERGATNCLLQYASISCTFKAYYSFLTVF